MNDQITIIGAGNLGLSFARGLVHSGNYKPEQFHLTRRRIKKLEAFETEGYKISINNIKAIDGASIIIIAVLPQKINEVLSELKDHFKKNQLIISVVSGVCINEITNIIGSETPIVRAMPNTAIAILESMTCITTIPEWKEHLSTVEELFEHVGETTIINEEKMTSATALCACGIAFFLRAIRAASQGGNEIDFVIR